MKDLCVSTTADCEHKADNTQTLCHAGLASILFAIQRLCELWIFHEHRGPDNISVSNFSLQLSKRDSSDRFTSETEEKTFLIKFSWQIGYIYFNHSIF